MQNKIKNKINIEEIISFRKSINLTQEQFAALLGTTQGTVNKWERGHRKPSRLYVKEINNLRNSYGINL